MFTLAQPWTRPWKQSPEGFCQLILVASGSPCLLWPPAGACGALPLRPWPLLGCAITIVRPGGRPMPYGLTPTLELEAFSNWIQTWPCQLRWLFGNVTIFSAESCTTSWRTTMCPRTSKTDWEWPQGAGGISRLAWWDNTHFSKHFLALWVEHNFFLALYSSLWHFLLQAFECAALNPGVTNTLEWGAGINYMCALQ